MTAAIVAEIQACIDRGETAVAIDHAREALKHASGVERAQLLLALAGACTSRGDYIEAMRAAVAAIDIFKKAGSGPGLCDALGRLGGALRGAGDHANALDIFEQAESIARGLDDPRRVALALRNIGLCSSLVGRHQHALSHLQEAVATLALVGEGPADRLAARMSLLNARTRFERSVPEGSRPPEHSLPELVHDWRAHTDDCVRAEQWRLAAMSRGNLAITLREVGHTTEAIDMLNALLGEYAAFGMTPNVALSHVELGRAWCTLRDHDKARSHYEAAIALLGDGGSLEYLSDALDGLSDSEEAAGAPAKALAALREWRVVHQRMSDESARAAVAQREARIELARLTSQWAQQAAQDPLTGLGNRRALDLWMSENLPRVEQGQALTLLLFDLDHFKQVNDRFGHATGDDVLRRVAGILENNCRSRDLAVRYGGEEFVLALASVDHAEAVDIAHRLRESIRSQDWQALASGLEVSVSIGVAQATETADLAGLLALADKRLYAAKYAGRDRVVTV